MTTMSVRSVRALVAAAVALCLVGATASCLRRDSQSSPYTTDRGPATELRLGYAADLTQAPVLIGLAKALFAKELGTTKLVPTRSDANPKAVDALLDGRLDAAFVDATTAIEAYSRSAGEGIRLISGTTSNGVHLVVRSHIPKAADLTGKTVATSRAGSEPDVALKKWLRAQRLTGSVKVVNVDDASIPDAFRQGAIDAAWVAEPSSSTMLLNGQARSLIDEASLWPSGKFPTVVLIARTQFLREHPATVSGLLAGLVASVELANDLSPAALANGRAEVKAVVNEELGRLTGKKLRQPVLDRAYRNIVFTVDPAAVQFPQLARDLVTVGIRPNEPSVAGLADLGLLNQALANAHLPTVDAAGLDHK